MFENKIGFWMKEKGLKMKYIADQVGVSYQTVSNWCNNKSQPDLKQSVNLARIFGISLDDLIKEEEEE
jgi:putative transcriptional regulator